MCLLTLVVPVYNMESLLPRCMETVLAQDSDEYEVVLVDDGSTDRSPEMCDSYASDNPELIRVVHKKNGGLSSARNAGIDVAKGRYIVFPDPDDWLEKDYVSKALAFHKEYSPDIVCVGHFEDYDDRCLTIDEGAKSVLFNAHEAKKSLFVKPCMGGFAWNKFYRLSIIREHSLRFLDDVGTTEDFDFAFRYLKCCDKVYFAPGEQLYHYYQREGAATRSGYSDKQFDAIHTFEKIIAECDNDGSDDIGILAKEEICNTATNLIYLIKSDDKYKKSPKLRLLRKYVIDNLSVYLKSKRFGTGRKVQAVTAYLMPTLYSKVKGSKRRS